MLTSPCNLANTASGQAPCPHSDPTTSSTITASRTPSSRASSTPPPASLPASSPSPSWVTWHMYRQASPHLHVGFIQIWFNFPQLKLISVPITGNNHREGGGVRAGIGIHRIPGCRPPIARGSAVGRNLFRHVGGECQRMSLALLNSCACISLADQTMTSRLEHIPKGDFLNQAFFSSSTGQTRSSTSISSAAAFPDPLNFLLRSENCGWCQFVIRGQHLL